MTSSLVFADSRELDAPFSHELQTRGPRAAFKWLTDVLAQQEAGLRSANAFLVAYTGRPEAIEWIEMTVASPITESWGNAAALLGAPWPRLARWLSAAGPTQLVALDALLAYRSPAPNMAPLAQIAAPVLPQAPSLHELDAALETTLELRSTPRIRKGVDAIRRCATEILRSATRGVPVEDLPRLYLDPESFPGARTILERAAAVRTGVAQSISEMIQKLTRTETTAVQPGVATDGRSPSLRSV